MVQRVIPIHCIGRELGILHEYYVSHHRLEYWYYWCSMVCIKELHSQEFVLPKPRFTAVRKILEMEVHKPQCQLAAKDDWSIETHLLTKKNSQSPPNLSKKMSCYCGKTRKHPKIGIHFFMIFRNEIRDNAKLILLVLLRARLPVRRDVFAQNPCAAKATVSQSSSCELGGIPHLHEPSWCFGAIYHSNDCSSRQGGRP